MVFYYILTFFILLFITLSEAYTDVVTSKIASLDEVYQQEIMDIISNGNFTDYNLHKYPFLYDFLKEKEDNKPKGLSSLFYFDSNSAKRFDLSILIEKIKDSWLICEYDFRSCLRELIDVLFEQVKLFIQEWLSIQLIVFIIFETLFYICSYYLETDIFRLFVNNHDRETMEFKVYKASKIRTYIYFISKFSIIICKITFIYYIVETFFIFILSIFSAIAYVIYYLFFWSFYDLVLYKRRKFKSRRNVIVNRVHTHALNEIGSTYDSRLIDVYLQKIFNSDNVSDQLVRDIVLNVLGSLTDYALHYRSLDFDSQNVFNERLRSKLCSEWTVEERREIVINFENYRYNIMNYKSVTNVQFIESVAKIIVNLTPVVELRRNTFIISKNEEDDKFIKKIRESCDMYTDALRYDYYNKKILLRRIYYVSDLIYDVTFLANDLSQIQIYSKNLETTARLASRIKGKVLIKSKESEKLITKLKQLNSDFVYESSETEIEHSFSHYISKVMHMTIINEHLEIDTYSKLLDIGASFCDLQLGNGVSYCIADVEEQDGRRILNYFSRLKEYLKNHPDHCVTIFNGDVTRFDFSNTEVKRFVLHNSCYNIDLVNLLDVATISNVEYVVNSVQVPINILHGLDGESIDNEMKWSIVEGEFKNSNLTQSKFYLKSTTKIDLYPHSLAIFIDWFKRCSVLLHYLNKDVNWNSNVTRATLGYYNFIWCPSAVVKQEGVLKNNDDYTDVISIKDEPGYYTIVTLPRHIRSTSIDSILNTQKEFKNKSSIEEVATKLLETRISKQTKVVNVVQDTDFEILSRIRYNDVLIIKSDRDNYYQCSAEVIINTQLNSILKVDKCVNARVNCEFKIIDAISSLEHDDIQGFIDEVERADNAVYLKVDEKYYYLNEKEQNVKPNLDRYYVCFSDNKINYTVERNKINGVQYVRLGSLTELHNLIVRIRKPDKCCQNDDVANQKLEQYLKKVKGKQMVTVIDEMINRKICLKKELDTYYEQHNRKKTEDGVIIDYNSKNYVCDNDNDADVEEVNESKMTGFIANEHINCVIYADYQNNRYYLSHRIMEVNAEQKLELSHTRVPCRYVKYSNCSDETVEEQILVTSEELKPLIKIVMCNGDIVYSTDFNLLINLQFDEEPMELDLNNMNNYIF